MRSTIRSHHFLFLFTLACLSCFARNAQAQVSVSGWTPPAKSRPEQARLSLREQAQRGEAPPSQLYRQINRQAAAGKRLPAPSARELQQERNSLRLRIGAIRQLNSPLSSWEEMTSYSVPEGQVYVTRIASEGALSLRLHFTDVSLPEGARLFVASEQTPENFSGPYQQNGPNRDGTFWTPPLRGDSVVIEYFVPSAADKTRSVSLPFRVKQLSHGFKDERAIIPNVVQQEGAAACNASVPPEWSEAAKSVARLRFVEPLGEFLCTGTLLNTADNSGKPYVLTANHCFSTQAAAQSLVATWLYDFGDDPGVIASRPSTQGAFLLATGARSDFTLVELRFPAPTGVRFSGWSTERPTTGTTVSSIHHPQGSYKRFSAGSIVNDSCPSDLPGYQCDNLLKVRWNTGITEPGSSGGVLWTGSAADPRVAGTLLGGFSACDNRAGTDYFGRFDLTFPAISFYLTGQGCAYELSGTSRLVEASGGSARVSVFLRENDACPWTASSDVPWITISNNASGSGAGEVSYQVQPNTSSAPRYGSLLIGGQVLSVTQLGAGNACPTAPLLVGQPVNGALSTADCRSVFDNQVYADRYTFTAQAGQEFAIALRSQSFDGFLTLFGPNGEIVAQNDDAPIYGGARIPATGNYLALPVTGTYTVEATSLFTDALGDANAIGNYTLELTAGCEYAATLDTPNFPHQGGDGRLTVRLVKGDGSCQWRASSNRAWLTPPNISFAGTTPTVANVSFTVGSNSNAGPRSGTLTVAGFPLTVTQTAACSASRPAVVSATNLNVSGYGGEQSITVTVPPERSCSWIVSSSSESWLYPESGFFGVGNGSVRLRFLPNPTINTRTATLTIAGQTVTVRQEPAGGVCQPTAIAIGQTLNGTLSNNDCGSPNAQGSFADHFSFTAVERQQVAIEVRSSDFAPQLHIFGPNGDSNGPVTNPPSQTANAVRLPAEGWADLYLPGKYTIVVTSRDGGRVGNYSLTLTGLGGSACGFLLAESFKRSVASGGPDSITLNVQGGCQWTATSNVSWLSFPETTGTGGGPIRFQVAPNTGASRRGSAVIANRFFEVIQDAPCSYLQIYPEEFRLDARGGKIHANVTTGRNCTWNATSKSDWVTLSNLFRSEEGGSAIFDYAQNPGALRVGAIELAGKTYEVRQGSNALATVSAAGFGPVIAPGSIASVFGQELASSVESATSLPLPETLGQADVAIYHPTNGGVYGRGLLFFASPGQINFYLPETIPVTTGFVGVSNYNGMKSFGSVRIERVAPSLFSANATGQGVAAAVALRVKADGTQSYEPIAIFDQTQNRFVTRSLDLGPETDQVFLLLFGTGLRNRTSLNAVSATIGGAGAEVLFAGAQGGYVGLDQINVRVPRVLVGRGEVDIVLQVEGKTANTVRVQIK